MLCNVNAKFPQKVNCKNFNAAIFLPDSYIVRDEVFDLLALNFSFHNGAILSCHNKGVSTFFELNGLVKDNWSKFFNGKFEHNSLNFDFVDFVYSDFICIFDKTKSWFYYHTIDFPNILFSDKSLTIPDNMETSILSVGDVYDELGEYLIEKEKIKVKELFRINYMK